MLTLDVSRAITAVLATNVDLSATFKDEYNYSHEYTDEMIRECLKTALDADERQRRKKREKNQVIVNEMKNSIMEFLTDHKAHTTTEILCGIPSFMEAWYSTQKLIHPLSVLVAEGKVVKNTVNKKVYYKIKEAE